MYSYNGEKIGQGKENVKTYLKNNPSLTNELENKIRTHYGFKTNNITKEENKEKDK